MPRSQKWKERARGHDSTSSKDAGGGYTSVRGAYDSLGAAGFYSEHGAKYSNPHETVMAETLSMSLDVWEVAGLLGAMPKERPWRVLDLACGGGEGTLALEAWLKQRADRDGGNRAAVACNVEACDPYTAVRYEERTGRRAHPWSFEQIAGGILDEAQPYDLIVASFCLHLLEPSYLHTTLAALARSSRFLLVATPHKRPVIEQATGWAFAAPEIAHHDAFDSGSTRHRVRVRLYTSATCRAVDEGGAPPPSAPPSPPIGSGDESTESAATRTCASEGRGRGLQTTRACECGDVLEAHVPFVATLGLETRVAACECCGRFVGPLGLQLLLAAGGSPADSDSAPVLPLPSDRFGNSPSQAPMPLRCPHGCRALYCDERCWRQHEAEHCLLCAGDLEAISNPEDPRVQHHQLLAAGGELSLFMPLAARAVARAAARACVSGGSSRLDLEEERRLEVELQPLYGLSTGGVWMEAAGGVPRRGHLPGRDASSDGVEYDDDERAEVSMVLDHGWRLLLECLRTHLPSGRQRQATLSTLSRLGRSWYGSLISGLERNAVPISATNPLQDYLESLADADEGTRAVALDFVAPIALALLAECDAELPKSLTHEGGGAWRVSDIAAHEPFPSLDGMAFVSRFAAVNHSCDPNVAIEWGASSGSGSGSSKWEGWGSASLVALCPCVCGAELEMAYIPPSLPWRERASALRAVHGFECSCVRCELQRACAPSRLRELIKLGSASDGQAIAAELHTLGARVMAAGLYFEASRLYRQITRLPSPSSSAGLPPPSAIMRASSSTQRKARARRQRKQRTAFRATLMGLKGLRGRLICRAVDRRRRAARKAAAIMYPRPLSVDRPADAARADVWRGTVGDRRGGREHDCSFRGGPADGEAILALGGALQRLHRFAEARRVWLAGAAVASHHEGLAREVATIKAYEAAHSSTAATASAATEFDRSHAQLLRLSKGRCVLITRRPVLDLHTCEEIVRACEASAAVSGGWSTARHTSAPTTDMEVHRVDSVLRHFNRACAEILFPMLEAMYGASGVRASALRVSDAFVVRYDAAKQAGLPTHADDSHLSLTVALNDTADYDGGGTYFEEAGRAVRPERGCVVAFPGSLRHGGQPITRGVRYIIAAFLYVDGWEEPPFWAGAPLVS
jgi:hypothetical protein